MLAEEYSPAIFMKHKNKNYSDFIIIIYYRLIWCGHSNKHVIQGHLYVAKR